VAILPFAPELSAPHVALAGAGLHRQAGVAPSAAMAVLRSCWSPN